MLDKFLLPTQFRYFIISYLGFHAVMLTGAALIGFLGGEFNEHLTSSIIGIRWYLIVYYLYVGIFKRYILKKDIR